MSRHELYEAGNNVSLNVNSHIYMKNLPQLKNSISPRFEQIRHHPPQQMKIVQPAPHLIQARSALSQPQQLRSPLVPINNRTAFTHPQVQNVQTRFRGGPPPNSIQNIRTPHPNVQYPQQYRQVPPPCPPIIHPPSQFRNTHHLQEFGRYPPPQNGNEQHQNIQPPCQVLYQQPPPYQNVQPSCQPLYQHSPQQKNLQSSPLLKEESFFHPIPIRSAISPPIRNDSPATSVYRAPRPSLISDFNMPPPPQLYPAPLQSRTVQPSINPDSINYGARPQASYNYVCEKTTPINQYSTGPSLNKESMVGNNQTITSSVNSTDNQQKNKSYARFTQPILKNSDLIDNFFKLLAPSSVSSSRCDYINEQDSREILIQDTKQDTNTIVKPDFDRKSMESISTSTFSSKISEYSSNYEFDYKTKRNPKCRNDERYPFDSRSRKEHRSCSLSSECGEKYKQRNRRSRSRESRASFFETYTRTRSPRGRESHYNTNQKYRQSSPSPINYKKKRSRSRSYSPLPPRSKRRDRDKTEDRYCSRDNRSSRISKYTSLKELNKTDGKSSRFSSPPKEYTTNEQYFKNTSKALENWRNSVAAGTEEAKVLWVRSAPSELYYRKQQGSSIVEATDKLINLCEDFSNSLVKRSETIQSQLPKYKPPLRKRRMKVAKHKSEPCCSSSGSSSESEHDAVIIDELEKKKLHPYRLHPELWYNDPGEVNDGPLCRCSARARRSGIRHNIYAGELSLIHCNEMSNNYDKLYHYRITISPPTNFLVRTPTIINYDEHEYIFEGFSMFSHARLEKLPVCKVIRFNIEYTILYEEERTPENFTIRELDLFFEYLFHELLELVDLDFRAAGDTSGCAQFHFMPRFVRELPDNGKEILPMNEVLKYLLKSSQSLVDADCLRDIIDLPQSQWENFTEGVKGMVVTYPGRKPCSLRVDQLDRDQGNNTELQFPDIVHFGIRPPQLSYAGNPEYQKAWREYVKFRHLIANMPKPSYSDKRKLEDKENKLQDMRTQSKMKRDVTVTVNSKDFFRTGIMCDIVQHAMLIPVLVAHLRFHRSLDVLEEKIDYKFKNRYLLQLALTHPSYRENFGTNPDHARNSLTNCGIRQPVYGDRRIHYMNTRKRGINTLINIMSRFGKKTETESNITHNERLEFLGDAVVEFVTSIHLFHMFPDLEEGGLATYRAAIVQNQHLAVLAKKLELEDFMLYAHGSDLCHDLELRHAMANCFEALMGALFLDGGIEVADKVFGETLFKGESELLREWVDYPPHPLQEQEPLGDRKWISSFPTLQKLCKFEETIGIEFTHIRLLARAFTDRSIGFTHLTLGSNQRLEFLGDTVLQLIASEYLYKYFPEHHEGHLSLLRSSLVNNRTQAVVCNDLGMASFALYSNPKAELKTKDRADLLEAFLGALYVDKNIEYCEAFCNVCFFPRLQDFIMHQDWNDPKSKLQQCCLTLRTMEGGEPEIPVYNSKTEDVVCNELGMASFALYSNPKAELKTKDLLEAFLAA
uniref:RNase III domain-containing protein n=1 Tax=Clastoptera arizonana TaxID=38151 RepID=A0A1B6EBR2_9HEMI